MDEETLNRLATEALLEEAKIGARRAEILGPSGWIKPKESINKRFFNSTVRNVILSNRKRTKTNISSTSSPIYIKQTTEGENKNKKRRQI